ncbi:family 20 glycosylhydrolase [Kutzneria albida]|uniref:Beta-N-acetylhexosaminidase n=1 Tax=Kutzneria albida DSM 43870 TaxID=1449976 RepID=W5W487_9PSEU|nr:family 20 glycosylhydrolase [Kutzneria albida]AHH95281.1 beta-N-acetylhexosaminidase [Kutzneria albida DSM 43870]
MASTPARLSAAILLALTLITPSAHAGAAPAANTKPSTIPALRQWTGGTGSFTFGPGSRVVLGSTVLSSTANTFAADLKSLYGRDFTPVVGTPRPGDVYLALGGADPQEGYTLSITDRITITAPTDTGLFNGTRTVLQLLHQGTSVPQGSARDWPSYPQRGLMVDDGRKFFTLDWLIDQVRELAYLKMNYLHLHLSDNEGFRVESTSHPEVVSTEHLSKAEVRTLLAVAAAYHVTVVPEIDMPGHLRAVLNAHPDLRLTGADGSVSTDFIDLSKDGSYALLKDLITEYAELFPGPYFHIGADEYVGNYGNYPQVLAYAKQHYGANAVAKDTYLGFVNWADDLVRASGKTTRAWNDGLYGGSAVTVHPDVLVEFWYNYGLSPQQLVDGGHQIMNSSYTPTYYVLGRGKASPATTYEQWTPNLFQGNQSLTDPSHNLGEKVHVWCDFPDAETEAHVASGIRDLLRVVAQQTWGSAKPADGYSAFQDVIGLIGRNPAWPVGNLAANRPITVSSTETPDFPGYNAVDGDYATRWSSAYGDGEWITVDLGSVHAVSRVKLSWETAYGKAYQVQTSVDGTNWNTIYSTNAGRGGTEDLTGLTGSGRYVRMQGVTRATGWGYSLYEFEVY